MPKGDYQLSKTQCPKGHPYDSENTSVRRNSRQCKKCNRARVRKYRELDPTFDRAASLKKRYGISLADYDSILAEQGNCCVICGSDDQLCVDHDHKTGEIRGILCRQCNTGLGAFRDSIDLLLRATHYLRVAP